MSERHSKRREFCDCGEPAVIGSWCQATCLRCHDLQQWWKLEQQKFTALREEAQWEWGDFLRSKPEPIPDPPPNTLFTIIGYRPYFLIDRYAEKTQAA